MTLESRLHETYVSTCSLYRQIYTLYIHAYTCKWVKYSSHHIIPPFICCLSTGKWVLKLNIYIDSEASVKIQQSVNLQLILLL